MARHRTYSIEFKRQIAQEFLGGETLNGLSRRHDVSRNLIRIWVAKYEAGAFDDEFQAADRLHVAQAGDFGVFRSRRAARIAFAISAHADPATSPFPRPLFDRPAPQVEEGLYRALLDVLPRLLAECR